MPEIVNYDIEKQTFETPKTNYDKKDENNTCGYICSAVIRIAFVVALILFLEDKNNFSDKASSRCLDFMLKGAIAMIPLSLVIIPAICLGACCTACVGKWCIMIIPTTLLLLYAFSTFYNIVVAVFMGNDANFNLEYVVKSWRVALYVITIIGACLDAILFCVAAVGICVVAANLA